MKRRRVKITGIGPVTPAGIGREAFAKGIFESTSRVRSFTRLGEEVGPLVAAHLTAFDVKKFIGGFEVPKGTARHTLFALAGAALALQDAQISFDELQSLRCGVLTGSSLLDFGGIGAAIESVEAKGVRGAQPRVVYTTTLTAIPELISNFCNITARTLTLQTSCCAGLDAIGHAARLVSSGEIDLAICGGTEAPLHHFPLLELRAAGLTPPTTENPEKLARPFDLWRTTGVISEGACMFVLEPEGSRRVGYSFVAGYGFANDSRNDLCQGMFTASRLALADAGIHAANIDSINAWGPGHKLIDAAEAKAMHDLFGRLLTEIPATSIKGAIGTPLGAAPAIQVAAAALSQRHAMLPPTVNWQFPDPACPLNLSSVARLVPNCATLVNSHGVGNVNASLVLQKC